MIMVDVKVPETGQVYDFELDEEKKVETLLREIVQLIADRENLSIQEDCLLVLYAFQNEEILNSNQTLKEQGVRSGDRLILF